MKISLAVVILYSIIPKPSLGQDSIIARNTPFSPYNTHLINEGIIITAGIGLTYWGTTLIKNKRNLTPSEIQMKSVQDIPGFDRGNAGYFSEKADKDSYIPFHAAFAMPVIMGLINKNERNKIGQVLVLYTETMAVTGTLFTMATGNVYRSRPYVYGNNATMERKLDNDSHRSFYAGHPAAAAAATFYMAKVFADFNPKSKAKPYVWAVAATVPALVGYLRYKAGMHFLSDIVLGYTLGAAAGILVPQLHHSKVMQNVTLSPVAGTGYKGLAVTYRLP